MNIVVIGLGSMGNRRIRLLKELYPEYTIYGVDGRPDRRAETIAKHDISCYSSIEELPVKIDCAFICTSPLSHAKLIADCLNKGWHVFTELNLVADDYERNMLLAVEKKCKLFISSTFIYREEINYIMRFVKSKECWNYIYHIGQYLPDWHPWESYKDFFISKERTNGCREILAIELPWITKAFGDVKEIIPSSDKMTALDIQFDDNYMITLKHNNGCKGVIVVDVVSPCAVRSFEAYTEGAHIFWGGTPESIKIYDPDQKKAVRVSLSEKAEHEDGYRAFIVENAYKNEIQEFFNVVLNEKVPAYDFKSDYYVLKLIDEIGA